MGMIFTVFLLLSISLQILSAREVTIEQKVQGLYVAFFKRAADQNGLNFWKGKADNSPNSFSVLKELAKGFAGHSSFGKTYSSMDNKRFVEEVYRNALGQDGDSEGITNWTSKLNKGMSRSDMISEFVEASLSLDLTFENFPTLSSKELAVAQKRQDLITNKVETAIYFTNTLGDKTNVTNASSPEDDPAYLASIQILSNITDDITSVTSMKSFIGDIKKYTNPMESINLLYKDSKVVIYNKDISVRAINKIYFKESGTLSWGDNLLKSPILASYHTNYSFIINNCNIKYDIKAVYENNKDILIKNLKLECGTTHNLLFSLYRHTIPEENIDCSVKGQNKILYDIMKDIYLWYEQVPNLDYELYSNLDGLLKDLRYKKYDKWSYITSLKDNNNYFEEGTYIGTGYSFYWFNNNTVYIKFVYKNSPADKAGLKRGAEILELNGKTIKEINDWSELEGKDEIGVKVKLKVKIDSEIKNIILTKNIVKINSILKDSVLNIDGKKIGYLVFKSFIEPSREELKTVFSRFKQEEIDELILDLRYNPGGRLKVASYLASLIGGDKTINNLFETIKYNNKFSSLNYGYKFTNEKNSLGLSQVYIITTDNTASASESIINGLKPFLDVYLIGSKTSGKPVGMDAYSFCNIYLAPITFKGVNANGEGDYFDGIPVNCEVKDNIFYQFGDIEEWMLKETIYYIQNGKCSSSREKRLKMIPIVDKEKNNQIYKGLRGEIGAF